MTGQRLIEITDIPNGVEATVTDQTPDAVQVMFEPGGHRATFGREFLAARAGPDPRTEDAKQLCDTGLVDGFAAAAALRSDDGVSFEVLTITPWPFGYSDDGTELRACQPLIGLSPSGRIREVRLQGCYADLDGLLSTLAVLRRRGAGGSA